MTKTKEIQVANASRNNKTTFQTTTENISDKKGMSDKNNNWRLLGKSYNNFVFVSVRKSSVLFDLYILFPAILYIVINISKQ